MKESTNSTVRQKMLKPLDASTDKVIELETWKEARHLYTIACELGSSGKFEDYYALVNQNEANAEELIWARKKQVNESAITSTAPKKGNELPLPC